MDSFGGGGGSFGGGGYMQDGGGFGSPATGSQEKKVREEHFKTNFTTSKLLPPPCYTGPSVYY